MLENFRIAKFLMQERQGIMIMKFYGRETERKKLNSMFQTDGQMISLIYGRRRIGKSELIRQVLKETELKSIYYECKQTPFAKQKLKMSLRIVTGTRHE